MKNLHQKNYTLFSSPGIRLFTMLVSAVFLTSCFDNLGDLVEDKQPAPHSPSIKFTVDTDRDEDEISGILSIVEPDEEDDISKYRIYWGEGPYEKTALICELTKGSSLNFTFNENSIVPSGADHFIAYSVSIDGTESQPAALDIDDVVLRKVSDISIGVNSLNNSTHMAVYNNKLYFNAGSGTAGGVELWVYDETGEPAEVCDILPGSGNSLPAYLCHYDGKLYFSADGGVNGTEIWSFDGTNPPVEIEITPGTSSSNPSHFKRFKNRLIFQADRNTGQGIELWALENGTPVQLFNIRTGTSQDFNPCYFAELNGILYFQGTNTNGSELWRWDGDDNNNPAEVYDMYINFFSSFNPTYLCEFDNKIFFSALTGNGTELWSYDGSADNPSAFSAFDINTTSTGSYPKYLIVYRNKLYFQAAKTNSSDFELWSYDGINAPSEVFNLPLSEKNSRPEGLTVYNDKLYFAAKEPSTSAYIKKLWVYYIK
ncbi:MAG: hypothetical protein CVV49_14285 [Spirochaetae bacterium HGW-Spirochaetae-5]|nr:MAG: hypothetical protein CVV49_14285 [Spirochaetae bacterium HGW-Spirochaetae-5]